MKSVVATKHEVPKEPLSFRSTSAVNNAVASVGKASNLGTIPAIAKVPRRRKDEGTAHYGRTFGIAGYAVGRFTRKCASYLGMSVSLKPVDWKAFFDAHA